MVMSELVFDAVAVLFGPLQAQDALNALFDSLLGEIIQFVLLLITTFLSIGAIFLFGAAGMAFLSQDAQRQNQVSGYITAAFVVLAIAAVVGVGPTVLAALGFETMQYIEPVDMVTGG